ncbi:hypothetical protein J5N97_002925 [Dioscorea zingiberensis]|uniref:Importin N-terminal domain-containing protein n=1 Tax=Dioscorea zingiberensis TaxID=325984 RepID=A0A9D5D4N2_9LILI|nr:hypothetical protein J5N97_002925 [Dioscorea zingiberensis]
MDFSKPEALDTLSLWFFQSTSPSDELRNAAVSSLTSVAHQPGFLVALLRLASDSSGDVTVPLAATLYFKNMQRWCPILSINPLISLPEKDQIRSLMLQLMISSPFPSVRSLISEPFTFMVSHDFPQGWPSLVPEIASFLHSSDDYRIINDALSVANTIFLMFRSPLNTPLLHVDLNYCVGRFASPLLKIFLKTSDLISDNINNNGPMESLRSCFESQRLCCEIFRSLNTIELHGFFRDHMRELMSEFQVFLTRTFACNGMSSSQDQAAAEDLRPSPATSNVVPQQAGQLELPDPPKRHPMARPATGSTGRSIKLLSNHFTVEIRSPDAVFYHYNRKGCLLVRQSFFSAVNTKYTDLGGGVSGCQGFHSSFQTTQAGLSLMYVSTTMIMTPGPVIDFLLANQSVREPRPIEWAKAKRMLRNMRVHNESERRPNYLPIELCTLVPCNVTQKHYLVSKELH